MYTLVFGNNFLASARKLEKRVRAQLQKCLKIFCKEPFHPMLHTKPLTGKLAGFYSFRVSNDFRTIFQFAQDKAIILLRVKHRKDVYK